LKQQNKNGLKTWIYKMWYIVQKFTNELIDYYLNQVMLVI